MDNRIYTKEIIDYLSSRKRTTGYRVDSFVKFVFLCGKSFKSEDEYRKTNRFFAEEFIKKNTKKACCILSEILWKDDYVNELDLLSFEGFLFDISDLIILFLESDGAICELGAFTHVQEKSAIKLMIVNDKRYKNSESFINKGPIAKAQKGDSQVIYANLKYPLESSELFSGLSAKCDELDKATKWHINSDPNNIDIKSFIIEIYEIISLFSPIRKKDVIELYKALKKFESFNLMCRCDNKSHKVSYVSLDTIYKLLESSKLIRIKGDHISIMPENQMWNSFMFDMTEYSYNKFRSKYLSILYKQKQLVNLL